MTEIADLQSSNQTKDRDLAEAQQQLREKVSFFISKALQYHSSYLLAGGTEG